MKRRLFTYAAAFAAALAIRAWTLAGLTGDPYFAAPLFDEKEYLDWAKRIVSGKLLQNEIAWHGPLYAFFLAGVQSLFGPSLGAVRWAQAALSAGTVILIGSIAGRLWGDRARVVALILGAVCGPLLLFTPQVLPATLTLFLNALGLYLMVRGLDRPSPHLWLLSGGAFSLSATARPNILPFSVLGAAWIFTLVRNRNRAYPEDERYDYGLFARKPPLHALCFLVGFSVMLFPSLALNRITSGEWVVLQRGGGLNFYLGNQAGHGGFPAPPGVRWREAQNLPVRQGILRSQEQNRFYYTTALKDAARRPAAFAAGLARKAAFSIGMKEIGSIHDPAYIRKQGRIPWPVAPGHGVFFVLGVGGAAFLFSGKRKSGPADFGGAAASLSRERAGGALLLLYWLSQFAGLTLFGICERYRAPGILAWIPLSALFLDRLLLQRPSATALGRAVAAAMAALAIGLASIPLGRSLPDLPHAFRLGTIARQSGNYRDALEKFKEASAAPGFEAEGLFALGMTAREFQAEALRPGAKPGGPDEILGGRLAETARTAFQALLDRKPDFEDALHQLALMDFEAKDFDGAEKTARKVLKIDPWYSPSLIVLGNVYAARGDAGRAMAEFERAKELDPGDPLVHLNLGKIYFELGRLGDAMQSFRVAASLDPSSPEAEYHIALALHVQGQRQNLPVLLDKAIERYRKSIDLGGDAARARNNMGSVHLAKKEYDQATREFEAALKADPRHVGALMNLANLFRSSGQLAISADYFNQVLQAEPDHPDARLGLAMLLQLGGENQDAKAAYLALLERSPGHAKTRGALANFLLMEERDCAGALTVWNQAVELAPNDPYFKNNRDLLEKSLEGLKRDGKTCKDLSNIEDLWKYKDWLEERRIKK